MLFWRDMVTMKRNIYKRAIVVRGIVGAEFSERNLLGAQLLARNCRRAIVWRANVGSP